MAKLTERQILEALFARLAPTIREAFLTAIAGISDTVILRDLIASIEANDVEGAFRRLGFSQAAMRPITAALETVFEQGGNAVGGTFPRVLNIGNGIRTVFRFDVRNIRAEDWIRQQSSSLITSITEDARVNVMNVMQEGLSFGNNPRTTALDIIGRIDPTTQRRVGGIIGLNQQQEFWVRNARIDLMNLDPRYFGRLRRDRRFDSIVQKAIDSGKPLSEETISKLIGRYKDSLLQLRGETIARTETVHSLNRSQYEAYLQAVDMGATKQKDVDKIWDNAGDARVRRDHNLMEGQRVGLLEAFVFPDDTKAMFPGDTSLGASAKEIINCRCRTKFKVDWLADID